MKKIKIKVKSLKVNSFVISSEQHMQQRMVKHDGGYTWVG